MRIYHTHPIPFNFLNRKGMGIVLNKRDRIRIWVTRLEPVPVVISKNEE